MGRSALISCSLCDAEAKVPIDSSGSFCAPEGWWTFGLLTHEKVLPDNLLAAADAVREMAQPAAVAHVQASFLSAHAVPFNTVLDACPACADANPIVAIARAELAERLYAPSVLPPPGGFRPEHLRDVPRPVEWPEGWEEPEETGEPNPWPPGVAADPPPR